MGTGVGLCFVSSAVVPKLTFFFTEVIDHLCGGEVFKI